MRPTWSAAGERSASPPPNPKRTHNYMFPVLFTTQNNTTQTDVLGSRPWPRGLFTLSARLVDGAGAGRCRMPGAVSDQVFGRSTGLGAVGVPFTLSDVQAPLEAVQAQSRRRVGVR